MQTCWPACWHRTDWGSTRGKRTVWMMGLSCRLMQRIGVANASTWRAGRYNDGFNVYLAGGVLFGTVWGGIIFPPYYLPYFPQPIVTIVTIGPVFCQTVIIVNNRPNFSQTVFYTETGVRLFNPRAQPFSCWRSIHARRPVAFSMHTPHAGLGQCCTCPIAYSVMLWAMLLDGLLSKPRKPECHPQQTHACQLSAACAWCQIPRRLLVRTRRRLLRAHLQRPAQPERAHPGGQLPAGHPGVHRGRLAHHHHLHHHRRQHPAPRDHARGRGPRPGARGLAAGGSRRGSHIVVFPHLAPSMRKFHALPMSRCS